MGEFRYRGTTVAGKPVQGTLSAANRREARSSIQDICRQRQIQLEAIEQRVTFVYKVQKGTGKPTDGEQKAFSAEEVDRALRKMGFNVIFVRKKLLDFKAAPPSADVAMFIRICADLLRERLPYEEVIQLVVNDTPNKVLKETLVEINQDLKEGKEGAEVYSKHANVLGRFTAHMLGVASTSGNMVEIYDSTAKFLERTEKFKKNIRSALVMPIFVVVVLFSALVYYVMDIFPKTGEMFERFDIELPPMTKFTLQLSHFLRDNALWLFPAILIPIVLFVLWSRTDKGRYYVDRSVIKIPVIGGLMHKTSIEIFARVFYALYSGSGQNIEVIRTAAEACRNSYMEKQIKDIAIPLMVKEGKGFVESLEKTGVFTQNALSRFRSGAESGALRSAAQQLANYYETETTYRMQTIIDLINMAIAMFIFGVTLLLTLVSSETAFIKPKSPISGQ